MKRREFLATAFAGLGVALVAGRPYTVRKGDTLFEIAQRRGVSVGEIKRVNGLKGDMIQVEQRLELPQAKLSFEQAAKGAVAARESKLGNWTMIVAHHSAVDRGNAEVYGKAHLRRGMVNGLAYHFVIGNGKDSGDGEIEVGPRWKLQQAGGHVRDAKVNAVGVGICLVGNLEEHPPTDRQVKALLALVAELKARAVTGRVKLTTHKKVAPAHTLCPGKYFPLSRYLRA